MGALVQRATASTATAVTSRPLTSKQRSTLPNSPTPPGLKPIERASTRPRAVQTVDLGWYLPRSVFVRGRLVVAVAACHPATMTAEQYDRVIEQWAAYVPNVASLPSRVGARSR